MKLLCSISLFLFLSVSFDLNAQKISITQSENEAEHYDRKFFRIDDSRYLALHYRTPRKYAFKAGDEVMLLELYDSKMRFLTSTPVPGLSNYQFLGGRIINSTLFATMCEKNSGRLIQCRIDPLAAKILGQENLGSAGNENLNYYEGQSLDGAYHYIFVRNRTDKEKTFEYHGAVLNRKMEIVTKFNFYTDDESKNFLNCSAFLTNEGLLFIIRSREGSTKKSDYNPVETHVSQISAEGRHSESTLSNLPPGSFTNISWMESGKNLRFVGTLSPQSKKGFTRIVSGIFDPANRRVTEIKETDLTSITDIAGASAPTLNFFKDKGISEEAELVKYYPLKNGGLRIILEIHKKWNEHYVATGIGGSAGGMNGFSGTSARYFAKAGYVLQFDKNAKLEWVRVIAKYQEEIGHEFYIGMMSTLDEDENLHLFFHDNKKNEGIDEGGAMAMGIPGGSFVGLAAVTIASDGSFKKQFYTDGEPVFRKFATANYEEVAPGEILFDHYNSFGKMRYGLGKLLIKGRPGK